MAVRTATRTNTWSGLREGIRTRLSTLAYVDTSKRDLRLDFLRGLAVSAMVVDHVGGDTFFTALSGGNRAIVSAAEAFVFLSGLVLGMVYSDRIIRSGPAEAVRGMFQRALTLYKASAGMALAFLSLFLLTDLRLWMNRDSGLGVDDPVKAIVGVLTLHYSFHGSDVLVMYTVMLAVAPVIIYLLYRGRTAPLLLVSVAIWAIYQRYPDEMTLPWAVANSAFPVAAWQLLFVLGMAVGYHKDRVVRLLSSGRGSTILSMLGSGSVFYLLVRGDRAFGQLPLPGSWFSDATFASLFAKPDLGPGRVIAFLALAVLVYSVVNSLWTPINRLVGWFILPLGQNSLYVYIMHLFVLVAVYNLAPMAYYWTTADTLNTAAQGVTLVAAWIMVRTKFLFSFVPR